MLTRLCGVLYELGQLQPAFGIDRRTERVRIVGERQSPDGDRRSTRYDAAGERRHYSLLSGALIFAATTYDSASYTLPAAATRRLAAGDDPPRWHRLFWAFALTVLPLTLMLIGGLRVTQTAVLVVSLPILVVGVCMSVALVKQLAADALTGRP